MSQLIFVQRPATDPIKLIENRLRKEEQFETFYRGNSFRAELLRDLLKELKKLNQ